jgi:hypothetical protein
LLSSRAIDLGFKPRSGQTNEYEIGICCFYTKHAALRNKTKESEQIQKQFALSGCKTFHRETRHLCLFL